MRQRVRVVGIVRRDEGVLLLAKAMGRAEADQVYELPVGKIGFAEQPEEAMARAIYEYLGVRANLVRLEDAITFTNLIHSTEQENLYIVYEVGFQGDSVKITTERYSGFRWVKLDKFRSVELEEASASVLEIIVEKRAGAKGLAQGRPVGAAIVYTDGGSRGNPGPSGVGYYITDENGAELKRGGEFLGFSTSRVAEYYGLKEGIEQAIELGLKSATFMSDSLMMVNHMNGVYKVKNRDLVPIYEDILKLLEKLDSYSFVHVARTKNHDADAEVNKAIDTHIARPEV